jgi:secondary thiamine-phosphate synthase enzyme
MLKVKNHTINLRTAASLDFIDITEKIQDRIKRSGITEGIINIQSLHTTLSIVVNEAEPLLIMDMKKLLRKLAPRTAQYLHDNFKIRTVHMHPDESKNGHAHNKALYLPTSAILNITKNQLQLGEWQRVFAIELDNSRPRRVALQIIGI